MLKFIVTLFRLLCIIYCFVVVLECLPGHKVALLILSIVDEMNAQISDFKYKFPRYGSAFYSAIVK